MTEGEPGSVVPGRDFRAVLFGEELVAKTMQGPTERLAPELNRSNDTALFENIWQAPGLELRDRSLVTIAALAALGREHELASHVQAGLRLGITKEELVNVMVQLTFYAGLPAVHAGLRAVAVATEQPEQPASRAR